MAPSLHGCRMRSWWPLHDSAAEAMLVLGLWLTRGAVGVLCSRSNASYGAKQVVKKWG